MTTPSYTPTVPELKLNFDLVYANALKSNNLTDVQEDLARLTYLSEKINQGLGQTPLDVDPIQAATSTHFNQKAIPEELENKLMQVIAHAVKLSESPSLEGRVAPIRQPEPPRSTAMKPPSPPVSPAQLPPRAVSLVPQIALDYATGFGNLAANCWANSFLSLVVAVPSFKLAYQTVADYHAQKPIDDPSHKHGKAMLDAQIAYNDALRQKRPVSSDVSQEVRLAFNHLFGKINPLTGHAIFAAECYQQEDAYEAVQVLMGEYERILREKNADNPAFSALYSPLQTRRHYIPEGNEYEPDPEKLVRDAYSRLETNQLSSQRICNDYQVLLDTQNKSHLSFEALLTDYFRNTCTENHDLAEYLLPSGKLQKFKLTAVSCQFQRVPEELLLTVKRFGMDQFAQAYKIITPLTINTTICLPPEATPENCPISYQLDAFIVHAGGSGGGGHYLCYKKVDGRWIEADDGRVRIVEDSEIVQILQGKKSSTLTSYLHHYTRIAETQPPEAIALSRSLQLQVTIENYAARKCSCEAALDCLYHPERLAEAPSDVLETLRYVIWMQDKAPDISGYGDQELQRNPHRIHTIKLPWLIGKRGTSLYEQMIDVQQRKWGIATARLNEALLQAFLLKLSDLSVSNEELKAALAALPDAIRAELHRLIYLSHRIKFGEAYVEKEEYQHNYGEIALMQGDVRKTLLEAQESVLNLFGNNIVEQLVSFYRIHAEKLQYAFEKEQLFAFRNLLTHFPTKELSASQLVKAFGNLQIRTELKERIYWSIWMAHRQPRSDNYGLNKFTEDPRCVLAIQEPLIATPPLCKDKSDILLQLITLLDKESARVS